MRQVALDILMRIEKQGSFSHILIDDAIRKNKVSEKDEKLLTEIVYGTIERKMTLDYYLSSFIKSKKKVADWVMMLLRLSVFQFVYLDKVPAYAIIHEAVEIAKNRGHKGIASFVNGVLRNVERRGVEDINTMDDPIERLAIATSHPKWLVQRWVDHYGYDITKNMCETNVQKKPISIRVNQMKTTKSEVMEELKQFEIDASFSPFVNDGILIDKGNVLKTDLLEKGYVTIQDQSSMLAANAVEVAPHMTVLDTCSAPGGKTTYISEMMNDTGEIYAYDINKNKTRFIQRNAERLGLTNIIVGSKDARKLRTVHQDESFDRILIDAPCSGLGVIRSKPDIKYSKQIQDIEKLQTSQYAIIEHVAPLLKVGGKLVYSTCTVETLENEEVVKRFIKNHPHFKVDERFLEEVSKFRNLEANISTYGIQIFPQTMNADGFFISRLERTS